jgi:hypothetical protein
VICLTCRPLSPPPIMAVGMAAKTATRRRRSVVRGQRRHLSMSYPTRWSPDAQRCSILRPRVSIYSTL